MPSRNFYRNGRKEEGGLPASFALVRTWGGGRKMGRRCLYNISTLSCLIVVGNTKASQKKKRGRKGRKVHRVAVAQ